MVNLIRPESAQYFLQKERFLHRTHRMNQRGEFGAILLGGLKHRGSGFAKRLFPGSLNQTFLSSDHRLGQPIVALCAFVGETVPI